EKINPIVYFYNEIGKEVLDLSEEKTARLKDREQLVSFFRNEFLTGKVIYTGQELEKLRETINRMNYIMN
ncbi:NERD domain-containing protein, partial [Bacillus cereus]|nr:NERD domain-containing protein [Bacillus cereus]